VGSSGTQPIVLIIDDEEPIRAVLRAALKRADHVVIEAATAEEGERLARTHGPDVVLLDLGLPDADGLSVILSLRAWTDMPILVLSARGSKLDKIRALDAGADDYVTKPFAPDEVLARLRVALRHAGRAASRGTTLRARDLCVDLHRRNVTRAGEPIRLTPTEYKLLVELMKSDGKIVTKRHLLTAVWGPKHARDAQYLHVYMGHLRNKIEPNAARPQYFVTEPGVGYRFIIDG
jgi:two-component system KDP operon response regulator KdpE